MDEPRGLIHTPVMAREALEMLDPQPGDVMVDATIGAGGHAGEMLKKILPGGRLIGIDQDEEVLRRADENLEEFRGHYTLVRDNFRNIDKVAEREGVEKLDGVIFDVGVSSFQLDDPGRGFSFRLNGPLDMRMDMRNRISAYDIVNRYREDALADMISACGEERYARRITHYIVEERKQKRIETTQELAAVVRRALAGRSARSKIDPATRTFQALRIAVNDELKALEDGVRKAARLLSPGARICVISFHSLEDRIVKVAMKELSHLHVVKIITKKPLIPGAHEARVNPRARSAKLRASERV